MNIDTTRHREVFDPNEHDVPVVIVGAGATGSHVYAELVKLGVQRVTVIDPDTVEPHNLANQIYGHEDVGNTKVNGCMSYAERKLGGVPQGHTYLPLMLACYNVNERIPAGSIVFLLVDTMAARNELFTAIRRSKRASLIIETRMASTHGTIYTLNPFDAAACKAWRNTLVDDDDEDANEMSACGTSLTVGTTANMIACTAVWQMMQFFTNPDGMAARIDLFCKPTMMFSTNQLGVQAA